MIVLSQLSYPIGSVDLILNILICFVVLGLMSFFCTCMAIYDVPVVKVKEDLMCPSLCFCKTPRDTWVELPAFLMPLAASPIESFSAPIGT